MRTAPNTIRRVTCGMIAPRRLACQRVAELPYGGFGKGEVRLDVQAQR